MSARRRGKSRRKVLTGAEKWKNKAWVEIMTPPYVGDTVLGHTPAAEPEQTVGRNVRVSMTTISGNFKDMHKNIDFKITEVKGNKGITHFNGYELSRDYIRSQVRNHRSRVDGIFTLKLSDGARVRVTLFCITGQRVRASVKKETRKILMEKIMEITSDLNFPAFVNKVIDNSITDEIKAAVSEYTPIVVLDIAKIKVLRTN